MYPNTTVNQAVTYTYSFFSLSSVYKAMYTYCQSLVKLPNGFSVTLMQCEVALGKKLLVYAKIG